MKTANPSPFKADQRVPIAAVAGHKGEPFTPLKPRAPSPSPPQQPAFINPDVAKLGSGAGPQMVFTGPVFIGYPMEQAIQFMQHLQRS
jgi:hypothetical protein